MSHAPTAAAMAATAAPPPPADSLAADLAELKQQIRDIDTQIKAETDMAREQQLRQEKVLHLQTLNLLREQQNLLLKHSPVDPDRLRRLVRLASTALEGQIPGLIERLWQEHPRISWQIEAGQMDDEGALKVLRKALHRPARTTTVRAFAKLSIILCEPLHRNVQGKLFSGSDGTMPLVLKKLDKSEYSGYELVFDKFFNGPPALSDRADWNGMHLASFGLFSAESPPASPPKPLSVAQAQTAGGIPSGKALYNSPMKMLKQVHPAEAGPSRRWCWMPRFPATLDELGRPFEADSKAMTKLLTQLPRALRTLHGASLAHMDVKPSNIFVSTNGDLMLGDFGNVRTFGVLGTTTSAFVPQDLKRAGQYVATPDHDWWMLAMTVVDMMTPSNSQDTALQAGAGSVDATCTRLRELLSGLPNLPDEMQQLLNTPHSAAP